MTRWERPARIGLLVTQAFVALTALAGGIALILGSLDPALGSVLVPPGAYLSGSPFASYAVPGLLLIVLVGGTHGVAFFSLRARSSWAARFSAAGGFACLIWIFVQMIYIPFSALQALYFAIGLAELGMTLVLLGILDRVPESRRSSYLRAPLP